MTVSSSARPKPVPTINDTTITNESGALHSLATTEPAALR